MSIQSELTRLTDAKAAIKTAIVGKGVTVPDETLLDGMAALIESIEAGGGDFSIQAGTITFAESYKPGSTPLVISHSLNKVPFAFIAYNGSKGYVPKYQIAFIYKLGMCRKLGGYLRSEYSTIMYSNTAGGSNLVASSRKDLVTLSASDITVSGGGSVSDFNPDTTGSRVSTLVWFAIAEN